jgi:hypothetical protein
MDQVTIEDITQQKPDLKRAEYLEAKQYDINNDYSFLKEKSGIFFLWYHGRIIYIGCGIDLYQAIHSRVTFGGQHNKHFLFERTTAFSILQLDQYDTGTAKLLRDSLINNVKPFINAMMIQYRWADKIISKDVYRVLEGHKKENEELKKLRLENQELKDSFDNLISAAMKLRKEK